MSTYSMRLGLEVETVIKPRKFHGQPLEEFATDLVRFYNSTTKGTPFATMHNDIDGVYEGRELYKEWSITDDSTVKANSRGEYPVEIVAPIMNFNAHLKWRAEVNNMFGFLLANYTTSPNTTCGTHVHFSPGHGDWTLSELQLISKAIVYFEGAFEIISPSDRRANQWIKSNTIDNVNLRGLSMSQCFQRIDHCQNQVEIADLMSPDRYYSWNFDNLYYGRKSTIEFRKPPAVSTATACLSWLEFGIAFVHSARFCKDARDITCHKNDVAGLWQFINERLIPQVIEPRLIYPIFNGRAGWSAPKPVHDVDKRALKIKMEQDKKKNVVIKKLRQLSPQ